MVKHTADREEDAAVLKKREEKRKGKRSGSGSQAGGCRCVAMEMPDVHGSQTSGLCPPWGERLCFLSQTCSVFAHISRGALVSREEPVAGWALSPAPGPALGRWTGAYRPSLPLACFPNPPLRPPLTVPFTPSNRSPSAPGQSLCSAPQGAPPTKAPPAALTALAWQSPWSNCGAPGAPGT